MGGTISAKADSYELASDCHVGTCQTVVSGQIICELAAEEPCTSSIFPTCSTGSASCNYDAGILSSSSSSSASALARPSGADKEEDGFMGSATGKAVVSSLGSLVFIALVVVGAIMFYRMHNASSSQDANMTPIAPAAAAVATAPANTNAGVIVADNPIFDLPDVSAPAPAPVTSNPMFVLKGLSGSSSTSEDGML